MAKWSDSQSLRLAVGLLTPGFPRRLFRVIEFLKEALAELTHGRQPFHHEGPAPIHVHDL